MRLLLDECVARDLKLDLTGHEVLTVVEAGYSGLKNGALLRAASGTFDVLITVDRNIPNQQNLDSFEIAVVILIADGIKYSQLQPLVPEVLSLLTNLEAGELRLVGKSSKT